MNSSSTYSATAPRGTGGARIPKGPLPPPTQGRGGDQFPNVSLVNQTGQVFRLHEDLIRDKVVLINFMSIKGHDAFPVTDHLARVAALLGKRLGRVVFMLSITTDPDNDTSKRLRQFADAHGARPGWHFLTTTKSGVEDVSRRLRKHIHAHGGHRYPTRMVHYGNGGQGLWGAVGADLDPELIVTRLSWVQNGTPLSGPTRRAGPRRLAGDFKAHNRQA